MFGSVFFVFWVYLSCVKFVFFVIDSDGLAWPSPDTKRNAFRIPLKGQCRALNGFLKGPYRAPKGGLHMCMPGMPKIPNY